MNPAHDCVTPAGTLDYRSVTPPPGVVCPTNQDKPLGYMIDDFKRCTANKPTTLTWTFTKTYTKDEWDALEVNESYDLVKEGYLQIMDEWDNSVGMDSLSLDYAIDNFHK